MLAGSDVTMQIFGVGLCLFCWAAVSLAGSPLFLTSYIKSNKTAEGRNLSVVDPTQFLNVASYAGYITVEETHDSNLFFWYFPVANADVSKTPLIIWLQGGPGASSLFGAFMEIGPLYLKNDDSSSHPMLQLRSTSWGQNHSLLFIDNPVGAGFSFTRDSDGYVTNVDTCADHFYKFLQQFLTVFPELRLAPLFIAGESYAGRFVPAFAKKVHDSKQSKDGAINLQGLIMGNPILNRADSPNFSQIFYQWGLIDQQGVLAAKDLQDSYLSALKQNDANASFNLWDRLLTKLQKLSDQPQTYNVLQYQLLDTKILKKYINSEKFKENVHVGNNSFVLAENYMVHEKLIPDFLRDMDSTMNLLLEHYRILIYCGQLDLTTPCVPNAEARRKNWRWSGRNDFLKAHRKPLLAPTVAGYFKSGGRFTEVLISGAGHLVPIDKPEVSQLMVTHFVRGEELPTDPSIEYNYDEPDLDGAEFSTNTNRTNAVNITSYVLNGFLIMVIIVGVILYAKHRRRTHHILNLLDDGDSLNDAVLSMT